VRLELLRITADWMKHATFGINAKIPGVERDAADAQPPAIAAWTPEGGAATIAVFNQADHDWVLDKQAPPAVPAIYVVCELPLEMDAEVMTIQRRTSRPGTVMLLYITDKSDKAVALRDGEYTLRAATRSLRELMRQANDAARTRNNVCIEAAENPLIYVPVTEAVGSHRLAGAIVINYRAKDANP